ncbi:hypothetical protein [Sphingobacterium griseoflavum]|uniref:TonB C-terminal domain-containing protein n=1 Tax=Sphingobacterium griseoflavum TaxID=1474952 RepID=A0ABQ3HWA5_9SPHI|nr:hypothetical protein [Sphingobacterium griseoflavum]GHE40900.1 hypothetical protein GCM10017764_25230 [Sphingobacterium griseoflavum]
MENNYQLSRIHNYIHGLMSKEDMYALEREALDDPFLQEAIDGYKLQNGVDAKSLSLLQQRLERRVTEHVHRKNRYFFGWQRLAVGLVAAVMFVTVCTLVLMRHLPNHSANNVTEVELMDEGLTKTSVRPLAGADAVPVDGWDAFADFLSTHYSGLNKERKLQLSFKIDGGGAPYAVQVEQPVSPTIQDEVIKILESGPKWRGREGRIEIVFPE